MTLPANGVEPHGPQLAAERI